MWDNRSVVHCAPRDIYRSDFDRQLYRVTLLGDVPVGADGRSVSIQGDPIIPIPAQAAGDDRKNRRVTSDWDYRAESLFYHPGASERENRDLNVVDSSLAGRLMNDLSPKSTVSTIAELEAIYGEPWRNLW